MTRLEQQIVGDLISYQNDGKGRTVIVGKAERA
jgi:hypothetical protein